MNSTFHLNILVMENLWIAAEYRIQRQRQSQAVKTTLFTHYLNYLDAKLECSNSHKKTAMPLRSLKSKWAWRAQFLSYNLQILEKFIFFKDVQMIVKSFFDIFNGIGASKNQFQQPIQYYRDPQVSSDVNKSAVYFVYEI